MERKEVYRSIDTERNYQDTVRKEREQDVDDSQKSISDFILYMEHYLSIAKHNVYNLDEHEAMNSIRKVIALGVAAGEVFEMPPRI
jgi:hypothetical protein